MPFPNPGFKCETQRENFMAAYVLHRIGGPLARKCGARLRTGGTCAQPPLEGEARCFRHAGPDASRRHRERQLAGLKAGTVDPAAFARAEARRARNALLERWKKDPRLPGQTIDLGQDEPDFMAAAGALGVDVGRLFPAVSDWLRWRWQRTQRDRRADRAWLRTVREDLPRKLAAADEAVAWLGFGFPDKRSGEARTVLAALRAGGVTKAGAIAPTLLHAYQDRAARRAAETARRCEWRLRSGRARAKASVPDAPGPLTEVPVRPWTARQDGTAWKRGLLDRPRPERQARVKIPPQMGRKKAVVNSPDEIAELAGLVRQAGPQVARMFEAIPRQDDRLRFLRALRDCVERPADVEAREAWARWVAALHGKT